MLKKSSTIDLPKRLTAYYLFFVLTAVAWLAVGVVVASVSVLKSRTDSVCQTQLGRVAPSLSIEYLRSGEKNLQTFVQRIRSENSFSYCAVASLDGSYLAHSTPELIGSQRAEPSASTVQWGEVQRVQLVDAASRPMLEYRAPLKKGEETVGSIHVAVPEPSLSGTIFTTARHAPLAIAGPLMVMVGGLVVIRRMVTPLAGIESQLREAATAASLAQVDFVPVTASQPASLGWNRFVREWALCRATAEPSPSQLSEPRQQNRLDQVLNSLGDGVAITNGDGAVTFANNAMAAILDVEDVEAMCSQPWRDVFAARWPETAEEVLFSDSAHRRTVSGEIEDEHQTPPAAFRVVRHPLAARDGGPPAGYVWCIRDVTQQKQAEKMRTQFVDTATHELRTPLANIKAYAETLALTDIADLGKQKEFLNTINSEATRLARFVDDMLCVSSMDVGSLTVTKLETDVMRMLGEVVSKVKPQMDAKQIALETTLPQKLPKLNLDKDKIAATLVNLLGNAAKYTPEEGRVVLRAKTTPQELLFDITDTGVGISAEELPKVFDRFFRSQDPRVRAQEGTGLGLSLAQEVARLHGGNLTVRSELNQGTTFTMSLPLN